MIEELKKKIKEALENSKKLTMGFDTDYEAGFADGCESGLESVLGMIEEIGKEA